MIRKLCVSVSLDTNLSGTSIALKVLGKVNARIKFLARHASSLDLNVNLF